MTETTAQLSPNPVITPPPVTLPPTSEGTKTRRLFVVLAVIIAVLVLTTLVGLATSLILLNRQKSQPVYQAPSTPEIAATPSASLPSKYATDSAVLQINASLKTLMGKIDSVDLFEPEITAPNLDLHLNIPPQQ